MTLHINRDRLLIGVGVSLPLLVILLFLLATTLPRFLVAPPQYDLVFASYTSAYPNPSPLALQFVVIEGKLKARVRKNQTAQTAKLYMFDHNTQEIREIYLPDVESDVTLQEGALLNIPELENARVSSSQRAPDGYEFRPPEWQGGGLIDLLGVRRGRTAVITKNGAVVPLPREGQNYYSPQFLGWVIE